MTGAAFLTLLTCLSIGGADQQREDHEKKEKEKLRGVWEVESFSYSGVKYPNPKAREYTGELVFLEGESARYTLRHPRGGQLRFLYRLRPDKKPKEFDVWYLDKNNKRVTKGDRPDVWGIYEIKGEVLRRSFSKAHKPRPKDFRSRAGRVGVLMTVHRRKKDNAAKPSKSSR